MKMHFPDSGINLILVPSVGKHDSDVLRVESRQRVDPPSGEVVANVNCCVNL